MLFGPKSCDGWTFGRACAIAIFEMWTIQVLVEARITRLFEQLKKYCHHGKRATVQYEDIKLSW